MYDTVNFDTIENPRVTGGGPNNPLALKRFEKHAKQKAHNPFSLNEKSFDTRMEEEAALVAPGRYSPQRSDDIGGSEYQKGR